MSSAPPACGAGAGPGGRRPAGRRLAPPARRPGFLLPFLLLLAPGCGEPDAPPAPRTLLLLTVDTLRADVLGAAAGDASPAPSSPTPRMDALAAGALRYAQARTCAPLTLPAHATMLAGLPPAVTGVRVNTYGRLAPPRERGFPLLAERLREAGWRTAAFVSAKVLGRRFGLDQGFERYDDDFEGDLTELTIAERPGPATVDRALAWLLGLGPAERAFLWVHLFEPHAPYERDGTYVGDVAAADEAVGRLLDGLDRAGRGADAVVLLTSDHGEMLGDLGEATHAILLADGVLRVPFLLRAPGVAPGVRQEPALVADVAPTLAARAGVGWPAAAGVGMGRDLLGGPAPPERVAVAESLHAHHRYRWAQLLSASGPSGTLVDAGAGRLHFLAPAPPRAGHGGWRPADPGDPAQRALGDALAAYRALERPERVRQGAGGGGYGAGEVLPLLPPEENGRLPDPYHKAPLAQDLDRIHALLRSPQATPRMLEAQVARLEALRGGEGNAHNPEMAFLLGEAFNRLATRQVATGQDPGPALLRAEEAYTEALRLGRRDSATLVRACGVAAVDREARALERLDALAPLVPDLGCEYWLLRARLHRRLGQEAQAEAACREARQACRGERVREPLEATCR